MKSVAMESRLVSLFDWANTVGRIGLASLFLWSGYDMFAHMASEVALTKTGSETVFLCRSNETGQRITGHPA